jgi:hypothetical protein
MAPPPGKHKCEHCGQFFNCRNQHKSGFERTSNKVILERKPVDFGGGLFEVSQPRKIQSCCSTLLVGATSTKTTHFCGFQCYMQKHKEQNPPVFANNNANSKEFRSVKSKK